MITFYNTLTRKKEVFKPLKKDFVNVYTCGPTVYDFAHIGNLRAYIFADILVRYLNFRSFKTRWVMNITDIDDKTIKGAQKAKTSLKNFTRKYEKAFFEDLRQLNIQKANVYPRATEHIKEIQNLILRLYKKGYAYEKDGSIYFDISKFKNYGRLSKIDLKELKKSVRVDLDQYNKEQPADFVLWKKAKAGEPHWKLEIENWKLPGRPGWHIECSAMSIKYLGETLDFHLGGVDLIFPHHENEIAQSEAVSSKEFVRYWLHNEHLLVEGEKMAKSLGNFYTLRDLENRGFDPLAFRYLCLQSHYRSKMNFTWESLKAAENSLREIRKLGQRNSRQLVNSSTRQLITSALDNDLDTPSALAILHKAKNFNLWLEFEPVLGIGLKGIKYQVSSIKREILELVKEREELRKQGKFKKADKIRKELKKKGFEIEDTERGPRIISKV